jgi:putative ATP-dependent endonuclease of the OLD family
MKINSLQIKNFRTLENINLKFDGYFLSISGKNNAGKTSVIKAIRYLFKKNSKDFFFEEEEDISYSSAKTQWVQGNPPIEINFNLSITKSSDPGLYNFVDKFSDLQLSNEGFLLRIERKYLYKEESEVIVYVDDAALEKYESNEIIKRIISSNLAFFHNSTAPSPSIYFGSGMRLFHQMMFTKDEKEELKAEQDKIKNKVKKLAKKHREELAGLLGRLKENYDVEITVFERAFSDAVPLSINLKDKNVEIPLDDWGSGTQNKTQIMMSVLQANKIKMSVSDENRVTPIVIIEEPESFLHPSAQAEFGRVIRSLANDLEIQTIITTHSPYMLCQENPSSNILLDRKNTRGKLKETVVVDVDTNHWMQPFSEILGLDNEEFNPWKKVIGVNKDNVLLVEGLIDKEYLTFISSLGLSSFKLPEGIEVLAYEGKDALKNIMMLKFIIDKFNKVFITFDLDAKDELSKAVNSLSLVENKDYYVIGLDKPGKKCMEGLVPESILSSVYGQHTDLVTQMSSTIAKERNEAKSELKKKLLQEFKSSKEWSAEDLKLFKGLFAAIIRAF